MAYMLNSYLEGSDEEKLASTNMVAISGAKPRETKEAQQEMRFVVGLLPCLLVWAVGA